MDLVLSSPLFAADIAGLPHFMKILKYSYITNYRQAGSIHFLCDYVVNFKQVGPDGKISTQDWKVPSPDIMQNFSKF
ncbi:hypothetical protein V1477_006651 [Vespula maculifrons]|uniref:Uncharacterized protein n=1 Tax=Vespula maculifrons TaxID=7453 RepID=A0ABD2CK71_VESMC